MLLVFERLAFAGEELRKLLFVSVQCRGDAVTEECSEDTVRIDDVAPAIEHRNAERGALEDGPELCLGKTQRFLGLLASELDGETFRLLLRPVECLTAPVRYDLRDQQHQ